MTSRHIIKHDQAAKNHTLWQMTRNVFDIWSMISCYENYNELEDDKVFGLSSVVVIWTSTGRSKLERQKARCRSVTVPLG